MPLVGVQSQPSAGVAVDLDVSGEYVILTVDGLAGIAFDVDTLWKAWSTA